MRGLFKLVVGAMMMTEAAVAQERIDPSEYEIGMDYEANQAEFIPYFEGVPSFGIDNPLGGDAGTSSNINFNLSWMPGTTRIKLAFRLLPDPDVQLTPKLRVRFHYWPADYWVTAFDDTPFGYATDVSFTLAVDEEGRERVAVTEDIQGQDYMTAEPMVILTDPLDPRGWNEVEIVIHNRFDLPERAWLKGVQLEDNAETREAVEAGYRRLHMAFSEGKAATFAFYKPQMANAGASYGKSAEEWFQYNFGDLFAGDPGLNPLDSSGSKLRLFGDGRLATLHPSPVRFKTGTPLMFFYKDAHGKWHPRD